MNRKSAEDRRIIVMKKMKAVTDQGDEMKNRVTDREGF